MFKHLSTMFDWLIEVTWQTSILVLLILLVQWMCRHRLSSTWRFRLWWLVLIRLLLPLTPSTSFSLFNFTGNRPGIAVEHIIQIPRLTPLPSTHTQVGSLTDSQGTEDPRISETSRFKTQDYTDSLSASSVSERPSLKSLIIWIWLGGARGG